MIVFGKNHILKLPTVRIKGYKCKNILTKVRVFCGFEMFGT